MVRGKKVVVVMPAYNAEKTLEVTYQEIPQEIVDEVILVDDKSSDQTAKKAEELGIQKVQCYHCSIHTHMIPTSA